MSTPTSEAMQRLPTIAKATTEADEQHPFHA
jgi:hypothetical protein